MSDESAQEATRKLTNKQRVFVAEYSRDFNATQAAIRAGYSERTAYSIGSENLRKPEVAQAISDVVSERSMSADEVLVRLADIARGDLGDFLDISTMGFELDLHTAQQNGLTKLLKKVKQKTTISSKDGQETEVHEAEIELYDAQSALVTLAKHHGLLIDRKDITSNGETIRVDDEQHNRALSTLADAIGAALSGASAGGNSGMDAAEYPAVASASE